MISRYKKIIKMLLNVFKLLWKSSKYYFCVLVIANIVSGCLLSVGMIFWRNIVNAVQEGLQTGVFMEAVYWLLGYLCLEIIEKIVEELCEYYRNILSSLTNKYITKLVLEKTEELKMEQYDEASIYDKIKKANEESTGRTMNLLYSTGLLMKGISVAVSTALILISFNVSIMIVCLIVNIPMLIISLRIVMKQYDIYNERFESWRFIDYIKELLTQHENIKEIKIYNVTGYFKNYIDKLYTKYICEDKKIRKKFSIQTVGASFGENVVIYLIKGAICIKVILSRMTIGDLTLFISAIDNFRSAVSNILTVISSIFEDGLYVDNFFELTANEEKNEAIIKKSFDGKFQTIRFENVWFKYPDTEEYILKNISLELKKGKTYAIVGMNGSGKTTILKLLLRLYKPQQGNIYIDNENINDILITDYYRYVGAVFQDFIKYPLTIRENIGLGNIDRMDDFSGISVAAQKGGISEYIDSLTEGYDTKLQKEWSGSTELSLGQWQKLAISRAFFKDTDIMLLDEPTASLDPVAEYEISMKIKELMEGKTCVMIAHRFSTVRLADEIFVLKNGEIIEHGRHEILMSRNGEYAKMFNMQANGYQNEDI